MSIDALAPSFDGQKPGPSRSQRETFEDPTHVLRKRMSKVQIHEAKMMNKVPD